MNIRVLSILFAALLLSTMPTVAKEKKEQAKTEQTKKKNKFKNDFSNKKL